ncbi:hypothetical protein JF546_06120 [Nitratireductor aquimarinus]|uniref:hypothetical protein n=1 Tax=Nitratireductor aquimarinus TaxID=889300 RepID=UPI001A8C53FB|nr:hypothetical protein [Nitratireductor aquimarinus]MBN8242578.1 hypothetical protein [Nitratireductor aquimarinus]MBY6131678.1 hypothetical protein [Nitratireductor aquimarinus]MCA1301214.1 hypothetical protein [Nitratireductor aquimarinus]
MKDFISFELANEAAVYRNPQLHDDSMMSLWADEDRTVCSDDAIELFGRACYGSTVAKADES